MAAVAVQMTVKGTTYPIIFNANALRRLEQQMGMPTTRIGLLLLSGQGGYSHLQEILWAGLEGARLKFVTRPNPYSIDEVGDLIDDGGGPVEFWQNDGEYTKLLMEAWSSAFPTKERKEFKEAESKNPPEAATA